MTNFISFEQDVLIESALALGAENPKSNTTHTQTIILNLTQARLVNLDYVLYCYLFSFVCLPSF